MTVVRKEQPPSGGIAAREPVERGEDLAKSREEGEGEGEGERGGRETCYCHTIQWETVSMKLIKLFRATLKLRWLSQWTLSSTLKAHFKPIYPPPPPPL